MFVRFQGAILVVTTIAVGGGALEGAALDRRREISRQHYRLDVLRERTARLRLRSEQLASLSRLPVSTDPGRLAPEHIEDIGAAPSSPPLLHWRAPVGGGR